MSRKWLVVIVLLSVFYGLAAEEFHHVLPLGDSPHRFLTATLKADEICESATGKITSIGDIIAHTSNTDVYVIGEFHDDYACHVFQRDFIKSLHEKNSKLLIGFEFFTREDDEALELWRLGKIESEELIRRTAWYERTAMNFGYTKIILDLIRENKIKTIGLNVPRTMVRKVSRGGFGALSEDEKALFPTIHFKNPQHRYFIKNVFGRLAVQMPSWFENMYAAQTCWDTIMAESMRRKLAEKEYRGFKGVIIAGSFHVVYGLGIPFRYAKADRRERLTTIVPVYLAEAEDEDEEEHPMMRAMGKSLPRVAVFSRGIADYVVAFSPQEFQHFPAFGIKGKIRDGEFVLSDVRKEGLGEQFGLHKGDAILKINGVAVSSVETFRHLLSKTMWDESLELTVKKKVEIKK